MRKPPNISADVMLAYDELYEVEWFRNVGRAKPRNALALRTWVEAQPYVDQSDSENVRIEAANSSGSSSSPAQGLVPISNSPAKEVVTLSRPRAPPDPFVVVVQSTPKCPGQNGTAMALVRRAARLCASFLFLACGRCVITSTTDAAVGSMDAGAVMDGGELSISSKVRWAGVRRERDGDSPVIVSCGALDPMG